MQSAVARASAMPRLLQGMVMGRIGSVLMSASSWSDSARRPEPLMAASSVDINQTSPIEQAFTFLGSSAVDADTGEAIDARTVIRGSRRLEHIRFIAHQDLQNVTRIVKVSVAFMKFTKQHDMGDFSVNADPYEVVLPEEAVPRTAPAGTYHLEVQYMASNLVAPLHFEKTKFRMV
jgi:hypothetical protein